MKEENFILPNVILDRDYTDDKCTLGTLWFDNTVIHTLELPWKNNKKNISCIPDGEYIVRKTYSPAFKKNLWLVLDVPNRSGIRFHAANWVYQLKGCIAPGLRRFDLDNDGVMDILDSRKALAVMEDELPNEFKLIIRWKLGKK